MNFSAHVMKASVVLRSVAVKHAYILSVYNSRQASLYTYGHNGSYRLPCRERQYIHNSRFRTSQIKLCQAKSDGSTCSIGFCKRHLSRLPTGNSQRDFQSSLPVFLQAEKHLRNIAIIDKGNHYLYADILHHSMCLAVDILNLKNAGKDMKLNNERIGLLAGRDISYVIGQFATWIVSGVSVPLCETHPVSEWEYFLQDSQCSLILVSEDFVDSISPLAKKLGITTMTLSLDNYRKKYSKNRWFQSDHALNPKVMGRMFEQRKKRWFDRSEEFVMKKAALIVYTSGTTGRPKGVVLSHENLTAMIGGMIKSWEWTSADIILHILPLHHVHGIINVLLTPLACGATCVLEPKFDAKNVWKLLTSPSLPAVGRGINLFMAVPTVYAKLIEYFDQNIANAEASIAADFIYKSTSSKIRLMVSGSAALPNPVSDRWLEITGHRLLERYGMTEIGMALTNSLHGSRIPGAVGNPFPGVEVRIARSNVYNTKGYDILAEGNAVHTVVTQGCEDESGELLVRGPSVFTEYWNKAAATAESFTKDGWFKTGDTAVFSNGVYRIIGRTSVDIIKSGGYKISALDVERHLLIHPDIIDCAVIGLPDLTWGQKVGAVLQTHSGKAFTPDDLKTWAVDHLPSYQIPSVVKCVDQIPRNVMGKVNKKELVNQIFPELINKF